MTESEATTLCSLLNDVLSDRYWHEDLRDALKEHFPEIPWRCVNRDGAPAGVDRTLILAHPDNTDEAESDDWSKIESRQPIQRH